MIEENSVQALIDSPPLGKHDLCFSLKSLCRLISNTKIYFNDYDNDLCVIPFIEQPANTKVVGSG